MYTLRNHIELSDKIALKDIRILLLKNLLKNHLNNVKNCEVSERKIMKDFSKNLRGFSSLKVGACLIELSKSGDIKMNSKFNDLYIQLVCKYLS